MKSIIILVRATGSNNYARIPGLGIKASCTSSPEAAAERAAWKAFGGEAFTIKNERAPDVVHGIPGMYRATPKLQHDP